MPTYLVYMNGHKYPIFVFADTIMQDDDDWLKFANQGNDTVSFQSPCVDHWEIDE